MKRKPKQRKVEPAVVEVEPVNVNRQRWQEHTQAGQCEVKRQVRQVVAVAVVQPVEVREPYKRQPAHFDPLVPLVQLCMTPIPYALIVWFIWWAANQGPK